MYKGHLDKDLGAGEGLNVGCVGWIGHGTVVGGK